MTRRELEGDATIGAGTYLGTYTREVSERLIATPASVSALDPESESESALEPSYTRSCEGYVYFADQGIEVCETCGGCTCCDHATVDHRKARYRCLLDREGKECLLGKSSKLNHDCERDQQT